MFRLTSALFGERAGAFATLVFSLVPEFGVAAGSWVLPDGPLDFFLLWACLVLVRLLFAPRSNRTHLILWIALGALVGLAMLSKYSAILFPLSVLIFLVSTTSSRRWLATPGPWLCAATAAIIFLPVIAWNMTHQWESFAFQGSRILPQAVHWTWVLQFLGGQFAYLLPWLFLPLAYSLWQALRRGPSDPARWLLACLAVLPIAVFTVSASWSHVLPHWPAPGWLFAIPLLGEAIVRKEQIRPRLVWRAERAAVVFMVVGIGFIASETETGWLFHGSPAFLTRADPTLMLVDWRSLDGQIDKTNLLNGMSFVAGTNWIESGELNYALGDDDATVLCICTQPHQFGLSEPLKAFNGLNGIVVGTDRTISSSIPWLKAHSRQIEILPALTLLRAKSPVLELQLVRVIGFESDSPPS